MGTKKAKKAAGEANASAVVLAASSDVSAWDATRAKRAVEEVNATYAKLELHAYEVGTRLNVMRAQGAAAALGYATWDELVEAEVRVPRATAFRWMAIASAFSEQEFRELGTTRAAILVRLPSEQRRALLPEAKASATRELEAKVSNLLHPAGHDAGPMLGLLAEEGDVLITRLGELAGVGIVRCANGRSLLLSLGRDATGNLELHYRAIGGAS